MKKKTILVTGGAGYIGSHMVRVLLEGGYAPVIFDNLSTGHREFIPRGVPLVKGDLRRLDDVRKVFRKFKIDAAIHYAAAIVVPESVSDPLKYYDNNVTGTLNLLRAMVEAGVRRIVFSSSACVYGEPLKNPILENEPLKVASPYGATKVIAEQILGDMARSGQIDFIALRYFNVAGAHPSGEIGIKMEKPTHLIPNVMRSILRQQPLTVFGTNFDTPDGSCVRDYVHVLDLCDAHLLSLLKLFSGRVKNEMINLGNGKGFSVKEVIKTAEKVVGRPVPVVYGDPRPGDCVKVVASYAKARKLLGWQPSRSLQEIIASAWTWEMAQDKSVKASVSRSKV